MYISTGKRNMWISLKKKKWRSKTMDVINLKFKNYNIFSIGEYKLSYFSYKKLICSQ